MKHLIFGLIATVLFSNLTFGQANSKNPFDNAGKIHNEIVLEYLKNYKTNVKTTSALIETVETVSNKNISFKSLKPENKTFPTVSYLESGLTDFKNNFKNTISKSGLSAEGKTQAQKFIDKMLVLGVNENTTLQIVTTEILKIENEIIANSKLTSSDKEALLMSTSVCRYSVTLWNARYASDGTESHAKRGFWGWLAVGAADAVGGFAGGGAFSVGTAVSASTFADKLLTAEEK